MTQGEHKETKEGRKKKELCLSQEASQLLRHRKMFWAGKLITIAAALDSGSHPSTGDIMYVAILNFFYQPLGPRLLLVPQWSRVQTEKWNRKMYQGMKIIQKGGKPVLFHILGSLSLLVLLEQEN